MPLFRPVTPYWYPYKFATWDDPMVREGVLAFAPGADLDDPKTRQPDITVARRVLGWEPRVSLEQGLVKTVAYFRELLARTQG